MKLADMQTICDGEATEFATPAYWYLPLNKEKQGTPAAGASTVPAAVVCRRSYVRVLDNHYLYLVR